MLEPEVVIENGLHTIPLLAKRGQLLVVDDDRDIQMLLSRILSVMDYDVTVTDNGLEALRVFLAGSYDLVITDFHMPLMNGWELSHLVKKQSPKTPVIIIMGYCDDKHLEKLNMNCVDAIILKPFRLQEIEETVQRLLNSGT